MIWDDFSTNFLSAAQKAKAQEFAVIGAALKLYEQRKGPLPNISSVTYSQMRATDAKMRELGSLIDDAIYGYRYVQRQLEEAAAKAYKDANP